MKFLNLKNVLMLSGFLWVGVSFYWFSSKQTHDSLSKTAEMSISYANTDWLQRSKDLRFKLGQWSYNYHLVKTKGLDFDQDGFLNSEFEDIYFFKLEEGEFKTQWVKSKDMATAVVPKSISSKLKHWTKDQILEKEYIYFSEKNGRQTSKVYFGFPIVDDVMGEGMVLSSLDLDYVQLMNPNLGIYVLDSKGRFLYHPKKEYIGQAGDRWIQSKSESKIFIKSAQANGIDGEFIYSQKTEGILSQILMPSLVMFLGLCLIFGVLIFEIYMLSPITLNNDLNISDLDLPKADNSKDEYVSILKLNEIRESLNKMSLLSSVIKGRIDLAANGELDRRLFEDIKIDFENLDKTLEDTYRSSQILDQDLTINSNGSSTISSSELQKRDGLNSSSDHVSVAGLGNSESQSPIKSLQNAAQIMKDQGFGDEDTETSSSFRFNNQVEFEDLNFEDHELSFNDVTDNLGDGLTDDLSDDLNESFVDEGVVFQEYIGTEGETNDWAKIIEELTEEINTVEIKSVSLKSNLPVSDKDYI